MFSINSEGEYLRKIPQKICEDCSGKYNLRNDSASMYKFTSIGNICESVKPVSDQFIYLTTDMAELLIQNSFVEIHGIYNSDKIIEANNIK